jgi:hypothetical protein
MKRSKTVKGRVPPWKERLTVKRPDRPDFEPVAYIATVKGTPRACIIEQDTPEAERDQARVEAVMRGSATLMKSDKEFMTSFVVKGSPTSNVWNVWRGLESTKFDWVACEATKFGFPIDTDVDDSEIPKIAEHLLFHHAKRMGWKLKPLPSA